MDQRLKVLGALPENQSLGLTVTWQLTTTCNSSSKIPDISLALRGLLPSCIHIPPYTYT